MVAKALATRPLVSDILIAGMPKFALVGRWVNVLGQMSITVVPGSTTPLPRLIVPFDITLKHTLSFLVFIVVDVPGFHP